eukprot:TRINITY_DN31610_c0_g1_i1.p1 TRINITY_DN31610_c0_g1~~TRINITY_DN31610_c0_g1_i1.p1  ORF type:complete len:412 (-),score=88.21 TRINITY_DN31610_c0_g1_i1:201-1436(-)
MAASAGKGLSLACLRRVQMQWRRDVQRITLAELDALAREGRGSSGGSSSSTSSSGDGDDGSRAALRAASRIHQELKVRIAHRLQDFLFMPYKIMSNPSVRILYEKYVGAYLLHEEPANVDTMEKASRYWSSLGRTFDDHQNVIRLLGNSRRQLMRLDPQMAPHFDAFLDRFFVSRIGTHVLGSHFLYHWPGAQGSAKPVGVSMGVLQQVKPVAFIQDMAESSLCQVDGVRVRVDIQGAEDMSIAYVPGHLRIILREVLQNAAVASAREAVERGRSAPSKVRVKVNRGQFGIFVTVSDRGGGILHADDIWRWGLSTAPGAQAESGSLRQDDSADDDRDGWSDGEEGEDAAAQGARQIPLGFGLPMARLTARYFGGDMRIQSLYGSGTSVYIHIPELREQGVLGSDRDFGTFF